MTTNIPKVTLLPLAAYDVSDEALEVRQRRIHRPAERYERELKPAASSRAQDAMGRIIFMPSLVEADGRDLAA